MTPNAYTAPSIASPHECGVPRGRRLPYGIATNVSSVAATSDVRNAVLAPGMIHPLPNQLNAIISFVVLLQVLLAGS